MHFYRTVCVACVFGAVAAPALALHPTFSKVQIASMAYCEQKYLGVHGDNPEVERRFEAVTPEVRGAILDCETVYEKQKGPPTNAQIVTETQRQDAIEQAHSSNFSAPPREPNRAALMTAVNAAHRALLEAVREPASTIFSSQDGVLYSVNEDGSLYAVCGGINSKNGFGGYTGEQVWIYVLPEDRVYTAGNGATDSMALRDCTRGIHKSGKNRVNPSHSYRAKAEPKG